MKIIVCKKCKKDIIVSPEIFQDHEYKDGGICFKCWKNTSSVISKSSGHTGTGTSFLDGHGTSSSGSKDLGYSHALAKHREKETTSLVTTTSSSGITAINTGDFAYLYQGNCLYYVKLQSAFHFSNLSVFEVCLGKEKWYVREKDLYLTREIAIANMPARLKPVLHTSYEQLKNDPW